MISGQRIWWSMVLVVGLAVPGATGCGDDGGSDPDGPPVVDGPDPDAPPDNTFTAFVIDLVQNQTAGNTDPRPYADFETLEDRDLDNPDAYTPLF